MGHPFPAPPPDATAGESLARLLAKAGAHEGPEPFDASQAPALAFDWGAQSPADAWRFAHELSERLPGLPGRAHDDHLACVLAGMAYLGTIEGMGRPCPFALALDGSGGPGLAARMDLSPEHEFPSPGLQCASTVAFYVAARHAFSPDAPKLDLLPEQGRPGGAALLRRCAELFDLTRPADGAASRETWALFAEAALQAGLASLLERSLPAGAGAPRRAL